MNDLMRLRKMLVLLKLRLLSDKDYSLLNIKRSIKKQIARLKSGKQMDLSIFFSKIESILAKGNVAENINNNADEDGFSTLDASAFNSESEVKSE